MVVSSNAGPLIRMGKCDLLYLLRKLYNEIAVPEAVYKEAVTHGLEKNFKDAQIIKKALEEGWIRVYKADKKFKSKVEKVGVRLGIQIGEGECETIALALEIKTSIFLTNDEDAYLVGKALGLEPKGVLYIFLRCVKEGHLSKKEAKESLKLMLEEGFWLSPTIVQKFYEKLDRL